MGDFPILGGKRLRTIPWNLLTPNEWLAKRTHSQTLQRLAERGGLGPVEAVAVIRGVDVFDLLNVMTDEQAEAELLLIVAAQKETT